MHFTCGKVLILNLILRVSCLSEEKTDVELVPAGKSVKLQCPTNESVNNFYVVKWYKDGTEFCRYYPQIFGKMKELNVLKRKMKNKSEIYCDEEHVYLGEVSLGNDGLYTCQVFAFTSTPPKIISRSLSLLVYPRSGPVITGIKESYRLGEVIQANCTAAPSNPPPSMIWYINGVSADGWSMFTYPCSVTEDGLCILRLGLCLQARKKTFPKGLASLVCEAGILALPPRRAFITTKLVGIKNTGMSNHENIRFLYLLILMKCVFQAFN